MSFANLLRSPRHLLIWFVALTLLPAAALVWAGWWILEQDKILEQKRIDERRDGKADLVVAALQQAVAATQQRLGDSSAWQSLAVNDAFVLALSPQKVEAMPQGSLLFYPIQPVLPEAPDGSFKSAEDDERRQNYPAAIARFRELTLSQDPAIRAGAHLGLARTLRLAGQRTAALDVYTSLAAMDGIAVAGNPAELVARRARCALLAEMNRKDELRDEAEKLYTDLQNSRWQLDFGAYQHFTAEVTPWLGRDPTPDVEKELLAQTVRSLWKNWNQSMGNSPSVSDAKSARIVGKSVTLVWHGTADRLTILVAGPLYLERTWLVDLAPLLTKQAVRVALQDADGETLVGGPFLSNNLAGQRSISATGLPWRLQVESLDPVADLSQSAARRRLFLAGLALLLVVVSAGSYVVGRAVTRELAVAQLQSDFVAAVSHEFRTPLTSLRQATELLSEGRQQDPARLPGYYQAQTRAMDRLQRLVETLLDFGRMEARAKPYRMQQLDVSEWVRSAVQEFQDDDSLGNCQIELQIQRANNGGNNVDADPEALARALRNLIDNASKYSPDCRTVWIDLARRGDRVAISVRDRGFGIPASERKQIFQKFVRGAASKTNGIKGTGVGLAMVQQIVTAHGGEIQLESEPGQGSTFTILLPESRN